MCDFNDFVKDNSAFLLTFTGFLGSCCTGTLIYMLKSRCTRMKCACISFEREPISESQINQPISLVRESQLQVNQLTLDGSTVESSI